MLCALSKGGMPGSARLRDCKILQEITSKQAEEKRLYGAICAAPAVTLLPWGLLRRKHVCLNSWTLLLKNLQFIGIYADWKVVFIASQLVTLHLWTSFRLSGLLRQIFIYPKS